MNNETTEDFRGQREELKKTYANLYFTLEKLYFEGDPIGINFKDNTDEYAPEVDQILPKLKNCNSEQETLNLIHDIFCKMFDPMTAGGKEIYKDLAAETWRLWCEYQARNKG